MAAIAQRLSSLEADAEHVRRMKSFIPVLFVTECSGGVYEGQDGAVFGDESALQAFAGEHVAVSIIVDDTRLKGAGA